MSSGTPLIECCVDSPDAALAAQQAGADRIELCAALGLGGLTPSAGLVRQAVDLLSIPVFVLVRPRAGDFCYSKLEMAQLLEDIRRVRDWGAAGIVSGSLLQNGDIDRKALGEMLRASGGLPFTFHRAFDRCRDPRKALSELMAAGVNRLLSSGQQPTAIQGKELLKELVEMAGKRLAVMPGGGIHGGIVQELRRETGAGEFHFSAVRMSSGKMQWRGNEIGGERDGHAPVAMAEKVRNVRKALGI